MVEFLYGNKSNNKVMEQYIKKSALVAEIERIKKEEYPVDTYEGRCKLFWFEQFLYFLNTLETKEIEEKFECPNIKIKDAIEVSSRMKYIDEDLKPIADFIMDYASWNLHKDEWNQPVLEVPLFRVLDALAQRGKPYCGAN